MVMTALNMLRLFMSTTNTTLVADIENHPTPGSLGEFAPEKYDAEYLHLRLR